jgi:Type IV secretion system proteins
MVKGRILAAGVAAALFLQAPAYADLPVIDVSSIAQLVKSLGIETQQLTTQLNQLNTLITTYNQLVQTYNKTVQIYNSLAHLTNINQIAPLLNTATARNPLPSTGVLPGTITGVSAPSTLGGTWSGTATTYYNNNNVYLPTTQDYQAQQFQKNANWVASVQALAHQNLVALEQRQTGLMQIQSQISSATDVQAMAGIQARLQAETAYVNGQAAQAQNILVLAVTQQAAAQQTTDQRARYQQDQSALDTCQAISGLGTVKPTGC